VEDGPRSGFSLSGWKEKRPRKDAKQFPRPRSGQSLTNMVTRKTTTQATEAAGTSQDVQRR
jgi:hypothetical protein